MRTLTTEERIKLTHLVDEGVKILQEISDLKEGLKDTVTSIAEELEIKPTIINKAIRVAHKMDLGSQKNTISEVEDLLASIGKKVG